VTPLAEGEMRGALVVLRDVGHRRERVRRLNREVRRFEAVFDSPDSLIGVLDPDGTLVEVNQTALSFADVDPEDVVGRPFWETPWWAHSTSLQSELRAWVDRAASGEHVRFESTHVSAAGEEVTVDGVIRPVTDGDEVVSLIVESRDVTEQQEYARELERKNEHLDKFASIVSHDLRNPLNVARGSLELAREECDSEHLDRIGRAHHRMEALIEDLLTLAREGTAVTEFESVDLAAAMERCWQNVETAAADLRVDVDCAIRADRSRFQQLAENLMRNAIQHGGPDVTVTVGRLDDGDGFFVADDGPGIPAAERDRVFEFGYSADGAGTGFGLDIVTAVAAAHGWDVEATESADGGARFEIRGVDCE
jgi:PAS domain S-box-containing protein